MGDSNFDKTSGIGFVTAFYLQSEITAGNQLSGSQSATLSASAALTIVTTAASSSKVTLKTVAADGGFASLSGTTKALVTGTISGVLAPY